MEDRKRRDVGTFERYTPEEFHRGSGVRGRKSLRNDGDQVIGGETQQGEEEVRVLSTAEYDMFWSGSFFVSASDSIYPKLLLSNRFVRHEFESSIATFLRDHVTPRFVCMDDPTLPTFDKIMDWYSCFHCVIPIDVDTSKFNNSKQLFTLIVNLNPVPIRVEYFPTSRKFLEILQHCSMEQNIDKLHTAVQSFGSVAKPVVRVLNFGDMIFLPHSVLHRFFTTAQDAKFTPDMSFPKSPVLISIVCECLPKRLSTKPSYVEYPMVDVNILEPKFAHVENVFLQFAFQSRNVVDGSLDMLETVDQSIGRSKLVPLETESEKTTAVTIYLEQIYRQSNWRQLEILRRNFVDRLGFSEDEFLSNTSAQTLAHWAVCARREPHIFFGEHVGLDTLDDEERTSMNLFAATIPGVRPRVPKDVPLSQENWTAAFTLLGGENASIDKLLSLLGKVVTVPWTELAANRFDHLPLHVQTAIKQNAEQIGSSCTCVDVCSKISGCANACAQGFCGPTNCLKAKSNLDCGNQIEHMTFPECEVSFSGNQQVGNALFACERIDVGQLIMEYTGFFEVQQNSQRLGYCLRVAVDRKIWGKDHVMLDAYEGGSKARFVNHSHHNNARIDIFTRNDQPEAWLVSIATIHKGTPISIVYAEENLGFTCRCNSSLCPDKLKNE